MGNQSRKNIFSNSFWPTLNVQRLSLRKKNYITELEPDSLRVVSGPKIFEKYKNFFMKPMIFTYVFKGDNREIITKITPITFFEKMGNPVTITESKKISLS